MTTTYERNCPDYEQSCCPMCGGTSPDGHRECLALLADDRFPARGYPYHDEDEDE